MVNIGQKKERIIKAVADGLLSKEEIFKQMEKLREREESISTRTSIIKEVLSSIPDPERIKRISKFANKVSQAASKNRPQFILKRSYDYQREFVESSFAGLDSDNNRLGVYVSETQIEDKPWSFEIRGLLENTILGLPLSDDNLIDLFNLDSDYQDIAKELRDIRTGFASHLPIQSLP